jgi:hemolysin-activating ACP:hemolysin acyltransferase
MFSIEVNQSSSFAAMDVLERLLPLMRASKLHSLYTVDVFSKNIMPSLLLGQYLFIQNEKSQFIGFINWLVLSDSDFESIEKNNGILSYTHWGKAEGRILFFPEMIFLGESIFPYIRHLKDVVFPNFDRAYAMRSDCSGLIKNRLRIFRLRGFKSEVQHPGFQ